MLVTKALRERQRHEGVQVVEKKKTQLEILIEKEQMEIDKDRKKGHDPYEEKCFYSLPKSGGEGCVVTFFLCH